MWRCGIVGLDTTHTTVWVRILQGRNTPLALYDEGAVYTESEVAEFCATHGVRHCHSLAELVERSDVAAVLGCDWDRHVTLAAPFVAAGRTVYIDKPVAGRDEDLAILSAWPAAKLVLGSCNRYEPRLLAWRDRPVLEVSVNCALRDDFYYAIHAVEVARTVLRLADARVRWCARGIESMSDDGRCIRINFRAGPPGIEVEVNSPTPGEAETKFSFSPGGALQDRLIDEVERVHAGQLPQFGAAEAVLALRFLRAAFTSRNRNGEWVPTHAPDLVTFSGAEFANRYRLAKHPPR